MRSRSIILASLLVASAARAESQAHIAAGLNRDGERALSAQRYREATRKFQGAVARVPEPRYFLNLCMSLDGEHRLSDALVACKAAANTSSSDELTAKARARIAKIREQARARHVELDDAP
jgi:hypothetical protein